MEGLQPSSIVVKLTWKNPHETDKETSYFGWTGQISSSRSRRPTNSNLSSRSLSQQYEDGLFIEVDYALADIVNLPDGHIVKIFRIDYGFQ
jgi:hypothetical protein